MLPDNRIALEALLAEMRCIHEQLYHHHAGLCVLHLEAAIAALESHLIRNGVAIEKLEQPSPLSLRD